MTAGRIHLPTWFLVLTLLGCDRPDPAGVGAPSFTVGGVGRPSVLVNPNAVQLVPPSNERSTRNVSAIPEVSYQYTVMMLLEAG